MISNQFDYIIIGSGLAGLQLALSLSRDEYFQNKKIALLDKSLKTENDKTWCFWEQGEGKWESIIHKSWSAGEVITSNKQIDFQLEPYRYKMIRSIDFYNYVLAELKKISTVEFIHEEVISAEEKENTVTVSTPSQTYQAAQVFDSRIPKEYFSNQKDYINIFQHFKGWMIETEKPVFSPDKFTMMDYRLKWKNSTSFTYVLPISPAKAFVEYTFFTPFTTDETVYDKQLKTYIEKYLQLNHYKITETEKGIIPMTNFPFQKYHSNRITKIGTAGGWVKASTGYSFKHTEKKIEKLLKNIKEDKVFHHDLYKAKFQYFDKIFLKVLEEENEKGEWIFENFYAKNSIQQVFQYLDEETTMAEDLKIMGSLFSLAFIRAFFKSL
ncbi:lycopene cyclase family protein [Mesonia sp.]|uniref:lycopene cyclase family protein n=1 Tax=Mesonia sp. TaxID=1960830 RepID=UPI00175D73BC|nr:lycopene cyclase family protein [Mesonia sp.]HIB36720.1 lycopene cyclase [Mesonia sp.]HIO27581.1 lycopene cyclase [Flavobacteriaceae bacterium]